MMSRNGIWLPTLNGPDGTHAASYHRSFLSFFFDDWLSFSSSLPTPNTFDQKPRFFLGGSGGVTVDLSTTPAGSTGEADAPAVGTPVSSTRAGAPPSPPSWKIEATAPKKPRRERCRSQTSTGTVFLAKYSV